MNGALKDEDTIEAMSPVVRMIYETTSSSVTGILLFVVVFILSAIVYKLGFARKIKFWQNIVVYSFLFFGCIILTFFAIFLPIVEGLTVAALILIIYRVRRMNEHKENSTV
ncbi:YlaH-like family protein [Sporosarcina sp. SAFN-015]|uniref:YlaH-like family protein n=1 Tax=Sporosarcina sp. SAFN-015 TaxID=3387274 RepID=UPI003F821914